jgi:alpha-1,6-mannosyltransferase
VKILDVTEFYSQRGGGVRSHLTLKGHVLCQSGHEVVVVAPGPVDEESAPAVSECNDRCKVIRIKGRALPYDPTYHLLWRVDKVRAIIRRERPDVLEIDSPYVAAAAALSAPRAWFGARTFMWHADFIDTYLRVMIERHAPSRLADAALEPLWAMVRTIGRGCDATIAGAKWQVDKLRSHGVSRVVRVPFGVDKTIFHAGARSEAARAEMLAGARKGARLIVAIGRFAWEKRWDIVIDAFARMCARVPARLVCFGDGPDRPAIARRAADLGLDARFVGFDTDRARVARALASADLLLHGCPFETFGLGVAEAVATGCPIVVPDEGGAAELAFGTSAALYRARDAPACAGAALDLLARNAGAVRAAAREAADKIASVEDQFRATIALYEELLTERRRQEVA